jgi:hypothetical protein
MRSRGETFLLVQASKSKHTLNYKFRKDLEFKFERGSNLLEKNPRNSPKLYLGMTYMNICLDGITCIPDFKVPLQVIFGIFGQNERF